MTGRTRACLRELRAISRTPEPLVRERHLQVAENTGGKGGTRTLDLGSMRPEDGYSLDAGPTPNVEYNVG